MKEIPLIRKCDKAVVAHAVVDDEDFEHLNQFTWRKGNGYPKRVENGKHISLHLVVAERAGLDLSKTIDHINRLPLDNRRCNLRPATKQQQAFNRGTRSDSKSGVKGVHWKKKHSRWEARIKVNGEYTYLGYFVDLNEAIQIRKAAEKKYFKEFASILDPPSSIHEITNSEPWDMSEQKYRAQIKVDGVTTILGYFDDPEDAARVRKEAEERYYGEFAPYPKPKLENTPPNTDSTLFSIEGAK
jgi:hypothetical protein